MRLSARRADRRPGPEAPAAVPGQPPGASRAGAAAGVGARAVDPGARRQAGPRRGRQGRGERPGSPGERAPAPFRTCRGHQGDHRHRRRGPCRQGRGRAHGGGQGLRARALQGRRADPAAPGRGGARPTCCPRALRAHAVPAGPLERGGQAARGLPEPDRVGRAAPRPRRLVPGPGPSQEGRRPVGRATRRFGTR